MLLDTLKYIYLIIKYLLLHCLSCSSSLQLPQKSLALSKYLVEHFPFCRDKEKAKVDSAQRQDTI